MMYYLESGSHDPGFNLALEQYVFDRLDRAHAYCMLWQNDNAHPLWGKTRIPSARSTPPM